MIMSRALATDHVADPSERPADQSERPTELPELPVGAVSPLARRHLEKRTAAGQAAYLLPHLRPGWRLLDCGCGPGTMTLDLAVAVAPGEAVGVDRDAGLLARAEELAAARGLTNVHFTPADVVHLPFADDTFDAVCAHDLLSHLAEPVQALTEMRRVVRRGGLVAIADPDPTADLFAPTNPRLAAARDLWRRYQAHHGRPTAAARDHRRLLLDAGFARVEAQAIVGESAGTRETTRLAARLLAERLEDADFVDFIVDQGWTDIEALEAMYEAMLAWGHRPDAFVAGLAVAAIGWKP